jgi:phage shock protein PspC (stress-responsive transcriptional regulator)
MASSPWIPHDAVMQTTEPATRRGLVRRPTDRLIAGVAGGLAEATGSRATWWRLGFSILALVGGLGVALYLILWVVLPRADRPRSTAQRIADRFPGMPGWVGVGLLGFGLLLLVGHFWPAGMFPRLFVPPFAHEIRDASPGFAFAVLLIGLGILLFRGSGERDAIDTSERTPGASEIVGEALPSLPRSVRPPRLRRERSVTGWLSFGIALAAAGIGWLLVVSGTVHLSLGQMLALPLVVLGVGLLVGTVFGRARWTVLLGLPLIPLVFIASLIPTPITGHYEDRYLTPRNVGQVQSTYQQSGGTLSLDFTRLRRGEHPGPILATLGVGSIEVFLPKGMAVDIRGSVGLGSLRFAGTTVNGLGVSDEFHVSGSSPIQMTLELGFGEVNVYVRASARRPARRVGRDENP